MLMDIFKLGLKDIWRNKWIFLCFVGFILTVSLVLAAIGATLVRLYRQPTDSLEVKRYYETVPISYSFEEMDRIEEQLNQLFQEGGYGSFNINGSDLVGEKFDVFSTIFVGELEKYGDNRILWCMPSQMFSQVHAVRSEDIRIVNRENIDLDIVKRINWNKLPEEGDVFFELTSHEFRDIASFSPDVSQWCELVESSYFSKEDRKTGLDTKMEEIFQQGPIRLYKQSLDFKCKDEMYFMRHYMYVYGILSVLSMLVCFFLFLKYLYSKLCEEYRIHLICGATMRSILGRNCIFILAMGLGSLLIMNYLNRFQWNEMAQWGLAITLLWMVALGIATMAMLGSKSIGTKIKGDM
ncbi:MAG: hypothetical protein Q4Q17_00720 [Tissierellia bacterium]|nr:hypothetical protein [Tissierellia bacterium]